MPLTLAFCASGGMGIWTISDNEVLNTSRKMPCDGDDDLQENPMYDSAVWTGHQSSLEHIYSSPSVMRLHHNIPTELNLSYALPSDGEKSFEKEECSLYV